MSLLELDLSLNSKRLHEIAFEFERRSRAVGLHADLLHQVGELIEIVATNPVNAIDREKYDAVSDRQYKAIVEGRFTESDMCELRQDGENLLNLKNK
jgi:hypothetical protein